MERNLVVVGVVVAVPETRRDAAIKRVVEQRAVVLMILFRGKNKSTM